MAYYYLAASLPPMEFGDLPELSTMELLDQYGMNFDKQAREQLAVLRLWFDLQNIRQLYTFRSGPVHLDVRGNFAKQELKQALEDQHGLPEYVYDFLRQHEAHKDALSHFAELVSTYFVTEASKASGFVREYLAFERNLRLILTGFRAKKLKRDMRKEFAFEDMHDDIVSAIFAQQESPYFEAPAGYEELQEMFLAAEDHPMHQYRYLAELRFRRLREMVQGKPFTLDYLLSYLLRVVLLEDLHSLDDTQGLEVLNGILKDTA